MPRAITAEALDSVAFDGERLLIEREGKPLAAVVSLADLALLRRIDDEEDLEAVRAAEAEPGANLTLEEAFAFLDAE
jgi:antitoxin (DNA-binding transcriptional repressor) of toxin-antitoxin stability system